MKQNFDTRIKKGLFPEMPQSFADGLQRAAAACGSQDTRTESTPETGSEPKKRRFPVGKVLAGAAAAVLVAACVVIAFFIPGVGRSSHGAADPVVDLLLGKWTVTEIRIDDNIVDPKTIGDVQITLEFSEDGNATLSGVAPQGAIRGDIQEIGQYTVTGNTVILTDEGGDTLELSYDPAADTLYMEHTYPVGENWDTPMTLALIFSRTRDAVKTPLPEDMLEGLWCALNGDPDQILLLEIRFYTDAATSERKAEIIKDGISRDGYSYTVEEGERNEWKTDNPWYRFTFTDGDEAFMIDMCMDVDNKEPDYMDWNVDKSDGGTYLKCPVIEANELPMQYTEYYGAGEGFVGFLAAVDLNGDGNPVRVKVTSNDPNWFIEKSEEPELTVQIGRGEWTANEVLVWDSVIFADLDPNDGHGNVLLSVKRADETIFTYELYSEGDTVVCGHVGEGYSNTYAMSTNIDLYEKTSVGAWSHTVGLDYEQRITIRADGTATLKQTAGALGTFDIQLIYTEKNGELQFVSAYTGRNDSFTAVYDAERDVLTVTMNGETAEYERCIPDLAGSLWTITEVELNGGVITPEEMIGREMNLEFNADGTVIATVLLGDESTRQTFRYMTNGTSIHIWNADDADSKDTFAYDAATDTLRIRVDGNSYFGIQGIMTFSRTPDAQIPADNEPDLVGKWTLMRTEKITESTIQFGVEMLKWGDVTDQVDYQSYLEFTADGHVYLTLYYSPDDGEALHDSATYTVSGNTIKTEWSPVTEPGAEKDVTLRYDAESDTICMESNGLCREYYARTPDAVIPAGERKEIAELRTQYPEYFGLDTSKGLKVYVWQMAENDYSCALISGTDERSEAEIGIHNKGTTIEQMLLILSTYDVPSEQIEIVPFENPISSYAYEIDKAYTARVKWLLLGTPIEDGGDLLYAVPINTVVYDVDGDGLLETCVLSYGPTSGLFTVVFHVYRNGTPVYLNTFNMAYGELYFFRSSDGLILERFSPGHDNVPFDAATYRITIENGVIVLTDESTGERAEYWGLADPQWNMKGGA